MAGTRPIVTNPPGTVPRWQQTPQPPGTGQTAPRGPVVPVPGGRPAPIPLPPRPIAPPPAPTPYPQPRNTPPPTIPTDPTLPPIGTGTIPAASRDIQAFNMSGGQTNVTPFAESPGILAAGQRISGSDIANSPAIAAALQDFQMNVRPGIQNEMALSGLGRSSATANALARAQAGILSPLYQSAYGLENERLSRTYGATESELGRRDAAQQREAQALRDQATMLLGYGQTQTERTTNAIGQAMAAGKTEREIRQQYGDAAYNDFLRQQALAEETTMGPFGNMIGSTFGSIVRQSK